jgi:cytochrome c oxidase cbb3-type subunit 2
LPGAFPPLKGSPIVLNDNPEIMIDIIMNGYSGRVAEGFGIMPPVGTMNNLSAEEITSIINHEKTSWGNDAKKITTDEVSKIIEFIKQKRTPEKK